MKTGIIGLPQVGKTSLFKILTKAKLEDHGHSRQEHIGVARVPDERLDKLSALYSPKKTTYATVDFVDVAAIGQEALKETAFLTSLRNVDALVHVLRAFEDDAIAHVGPIDPLRDIKNVEFDHQRVIISYRWQNDLPAKLRGILLSPQDQQRIEAYQRRLTELTQTRKSRLNLTELTKPLFQLAQDRSNIGAADAENRALILVLAFYINQKDFNNIIPQSKIWPHPTWRTVLLNERDDFPKHYLVSAMLAAYSGTPQRVRKTLQEIYRRSKSFGQEYPPRQ